MTMKLEAVSMYLIYVYFLGSVKRIRKRQKVFYAGMQFYFVPTCSCCDIHPGWVEPASPQRGDVS